MKKLIVLFAMLLMSGSGLFATTGTPITLGVKGYVGASNIGTSDESVGFAPAFGFGGIGKIGITNDFSLRAEILGSFKGAKGSYKIAGYNFDNTAHLTYLEIPVLAEVKVATGASIYAGPYFAFKLDASNDNDVSEIIKKIYDVDKLFDNFIKDTDMGITAGFEYAISRNAALDLRGSYGLTHISEYSDWVNYSIVLGINVYF